VAPTFKLEIVTPERVFLSDDVEMLVVKTPQGEMGVLAGHIPLVAAVAVGTCRITKKTGEVVDAVLTEGFMEIKQEKTIVFTDTAEWPEEIDANRAEAARKRAEERLAMKQSEVEYVRTQAALARAMARLKVKGRYNK
jgi:F-type H+-transporting ATPase subunit epsilon